LGDVKAGLSRESGRVLSLSTGTAHNIVHQAQQLHHSFHLMLYLPFLILALLCNTLLSVSDDLFIKHVSKPAFP
jgi:hypothetical protein